MPGSVYSLIDTSCGHYCNCCCYISFSYLLGTVVCSGHYQDIPNWDGRWFSVKIKSRISLRVWYFRTLGVQTFWLWIMEEIYKKTQYSHVQTRTQHTHAHTHAHPLKDKFHESIPAFPCTIQSGSFYSIPSCFILFCFVYKILVMTHYTDVSCDPHFIGHLPRKRPVWEICRMVVN